MRQSINRLVFSVIVIGANFMASNSSRRKNDAPAKVKSKSVKSTLAASTTLLDKFLGPYPIMEGEDPAAYTKAKCAQLSNF